MKCPLTTKKVNVKAPPDRWGNKVFEQWAAQNHIPLRQLSPVDKLSFIGKRGMGALEYAPATAGFETSSSVQIDSLYQLAKKLFQEREKAIVLSGEALNLQSLYEVGTSAGGQHPKAIIAINRETGDIRSGQVALPPDYTYYILKFAESDDFPFTNVEMAYYEMALSRCYQLRGTIYHLPPTEHTGHRNLRTIPPHGV